jgi:hypothetical protein
MGGATRAGARTAYGYGSDVEPAGQIRLVYGKQWQTDASPKELRPNLRGLFDLHGNAYEWTHDWYGGDYGSEALTDPKGPETGSSRVHRGGSWGSDAANCRSASASRLPRRPLGLRRFPAGPESVLESRRRRARTSDAKPAGEGTQGAQRSRDRSGRSYRRQTLAGLSSRSLSLLPFLPRSGERGYSSAPHDDVG